MRRIKESKCAGFLRMVTALAILGVVAVVAGLVMHLTFQPRPTPDHVATCPGTGQEDDYQLDLQPQADGSWLLVCTWDYAH